MRSYAATLNRFSTHSVQTDGLLGPNCDGYTSGVVADDQYILSEAAGSISTAFASTGYLWACVAVGFELAQPVVVTPGVVASTFTIDNPTVKAGALVAPSVVASTFALGLVYVPQPGTAYPSPVFSTFALGTVTANIPVNYGNVVSGSANLPGGMNSTYFYARWTGWLKVSTPGIYIIGVNASDGCDLYIGNQPLVLALAASQTANSTTTFTNSARIELAANVNYPIVLEWQHGSSSSYECQLLWTPPGAVVPAVIPVTNIELTGYWWNTSSASPYPCTWY